MKYSCPLHTLQHCVFVFKDATSLPQPHTHSHSPNQTPSRYVGEILTGDFRKELLRVVFRHVSDSRNLTSGIMLQLGEQHQSETRDTGTTFKQSPQTDWQARADAAACVPNPMYASGRASGAGTTPKQPLQTYWWARTDAAACVDKTVYASGAVKFTEEIGQLRAEVKELKPIGLPSHLGLREKGGPWAQLALGMPVLQDHLGLREKGGPWAQLALGLPVLQDHLGLREKGDPWAQLALGLPVLQDHLGLREKGDPRGQLALGVPVLQDHLGLREKGDPWDQLALGLPVLQDHLGLREKGGPWGEMALGCPVRREPLGHPDQLAHEN
ncbi:hypothetical protein Bbelb_183190 [Branchiostoma belcheri]|nr:hypothetical protein Bbelb_183190 [Branchiostoma belcheri]